jgi:hypothetical protein
MTELGHGSNVRSILLKTPHQLEMSDSFSNYRTRSYAAQSLEGSLYLGCSFIDGFLCQVRGIETVTTYDPNTQEFIINTPCESAQKYWIGGATKV